MATRAWFIYVGDYGNNILNTAFYEHIIYFSCADGSPLPCAVNAIYDPSSYGSHPAPFSSKLVSYLVVAAALSSQQPSGSGLKRYVYVFP